MRHQFQICDLKFEVRKSSVFRLRPCIFGSISRLLACCVIVLMRSSSAAPQQLKFDVAAFDRERVLKAAKQYLSEAPITITASTSPRSSGGVHDFFSEGDYWWPDQQNPGGPYIQRDGMSNPDNFTAHRRYLMRLSVQVPALAAQAASSRS